MTRARQRGVALLTAVVLVALATTIAVAIGFSSAMTARRSTATFSVEQGLLFAEGAEALATYVLKQDGNRAEDSYAEFWTKPYGPVEIAPEISLEAVILDEQGRFNLNTLLNDQGMPDEDSLAVFQRLLELLELEPRWAPLLVDWLDDNVLPESEGGEDSLYAAQSPAYRTANLTITSITELLQLPGFGRERYLKLAPYVTALPPEARTINICMASGVVLDALNALSEKQRNAVEYSAMDPKQLTDSRARACFPAKNTLLTNIGGAKIATRISTTTDYFRLHTLISIGTTRFALYSLLQRDASGQIRPILRTFGTE